MEFATCNSLVEIMTLERGAFLNGRYRIVEILGQGGMGSIYRAVDENLGVNVAVKENLFTTDEYARQFHREAVILAMLRHPNLPRVTDHFVIDGQGQYLVMDFVEGEDLRERLDRDGVLPDAEIVILGAAICDALSYLHSRKPQVVHRDIKPGNVKVLPNGNVCLVDFGLAKVIQGSQITSTGARAMTPGYSPPEQYGTARTDHRTDIYSLGATLYAALTGELPEDALARAMDQTSLTPVRRHNTKVARRLAFVIEKAMELRPEDRYQSAEEFKQALINTRVITGKKDLRELTLTPPPENQPAEVVTSNGDVGPAEVYSVPEVVSPPVAGLFHVSTPVPGDPREFVLPKPRRSRRIGCWLVPVLLIMFILAGAGAVYFQPPIASQAIAMVSPVLPEGIAGFFTSATATLTTLPSPTNTLEPTLAPTPTSTPTEAIAILTNPILTPTAMVPPTGKPTESPTPSPTPTGGGQGEIAYASTVTGISQIWLMKSDGTAKQQITDGEDGACQPDWSPDGTKIVYISPCASNQDLYPGASLFIIDVDGSIQTQLPTVPGGDFDPAWSPDGKTIVFTSLRDFNRPQIYAINLEDMSVKSLSANIVRDSQPTWSSDGEKIAFITTRRGPYQVWIMDKDGKNPELFSRSGSLKDGHPDWSPDSAWIWYTQAEIQGGIPRLAASPYKFEDRNENKVVADLTPMREAKFSPDGFWIAYESWPEGSDHDIWIMNLNGANRHQLTEEGRMNFDPAWRPVVQEP